ncbi:MAG: hypothetical protein HY876_03640, partial [Coriobacteriales bacterium]|nr:hypothetical protein [Coriobacteriales bacterium]
SAHGEAAFAGALGVRLGGAVTYRGVTTERAGIGAELREAGAVACGQAARLVVTTATTAAALACAALVALGSG